MLRFVELVVASAMLIVLLPLTRAVTFTVVHVPPVTGPDEPVLFAARAGALFQGRATWALR
jgi:hypothetical protein